MSSVPGYLGYTFVMLNVMGLIYELIFVFIKNLHVDCLLTSRDTALKIAGCAV